MTYTFTIFILPLVSSLCLYRQLFGRRWVPILQLGSQMAKGRDIEAGSKSD